MADMRRPVPAAGRRARRRLLAALPAVPLVWALRPRTAAAQAAPLVRPWQVLAGARRAARIDPAGGLWPDARGAFVAFVHPSAVAARGPDVYVADSGANRVYRVDLALQALAEVPGLGAQPGTRLAVAGDQSLYVLEPGAGRILHLRRDGSVLQTLSDPVATARYSDIALDETGARIYAYDTLSRRLVAFHAVGRAAIPIASAIDAAGMWQGAAGLASSAGGVWLSDPGCGCVLRFDFSGSVTARLSEGGLRLPGPLAADRQGRVFAVDLFDQSVKVLDAGGLVASLSFSSLGVSAVSGLTIDDGFLYLADGPGARLVVLRLLGGSK
jgi:sugar lactone lactonase YvrE